MKIAEAMSPAASSAGPKLSVETAADKLPQDGIEGFARPQAQLPVHIP